MTAGSHHHRYLPSFTVLCNRCTVQEDNTKLRTLSLWTCQPSLMKKEQILSVWTNAITWEMNGGKVRRFVKLTTTASHLSHCNTAYDKWARTLGSLSPDVVRDWPRNHGARASQRTHPALTRTLSISVFRPREDKRLEEFEEHQVAVCQPTSGWSWFWSSLGAPRTQRGNRCGYVFEDPKYLSASSFIYRLKS